jgi:multisubunit Na+/H+ antiporter MnhG subunit
MICCAMGAVALATGAIGWKRFRRFLHWRLNAQSALTALVVAMITIAIAGLVAEHLRHHAADAGDEQVSLTDLGALPFCRGGSPADGITDTASIEE